MFISIILERLGKADCPVVLLPRNRRTGWSVGWVWQGGSGLGEAAKLGPAQGMQVVEHLAV